MKWICFFAVVLMTSCNLFKNTSKTNTSNGQSSAKQIESSQLILKSANKETQVFTYWDDSSFYQLQNIKEHIDLAKSGQLKTQEKQKIEQETLIRKSEPAKLWIYAGALVIAGLSVYLSITYFKLSNRC
ncbi:hypothetical protein D3C87_1240250 [compost metagenome]